MTTVAIAWMVLGISWSGPRAAVRRAFRGDDGARVRAVPAGGRPHRRDGLRGGDCPCRPLQLTNLPNLRDYAKAPFTLALVIDPGCAGGAALAHRAMCCCCRSAYGLVLGVGYGFRTDLLVDIPPFLITDRTVPAGRRVAQPAGEGRSGRRCVPRASSQRGWPIITSVISGGGCQWHVVSARPHERRSTRHLA